MVLLQYDSSCCENCAKSNMSENFHDMIAQLCLKQFYSLPKSGKPKQNEWTILSAIVLENENKYEVVAMGTGTKCIGQDKLSKDGDILNDSHAEVICRRAFIRYIYECMLHKNIDLFKFNLNRQIFQLKDSVKFHFFSTHVPCGDAAIFSKQNAEEFGDLLINANSTNVAHSKKRGNCDMGSRNKKIKLQQSTDIFRTGAKCLKEDKKQDPKLEGANFHVTGVVRIKPGRGVPTLSVSCSDKLSRWCHLGVQGALLSILLDKPIYFSSFTICGGTPYNEEAIMRALLNRVGNVSLQPPFQKCNIILGQANLLFSYGKVENKSPCPSSIVWLKGKSIERQIEVAVDGRRQGVTKKQLKTTGALKISKLELFKAFVNVIKQFELRLENITNLDKVTYKEIKMYSHNYQKCWSSLKSNFKIWTVKNNDLMTFCVS
ncbi:tRNA-specific adenosine deaminase 1 [Zophobas morio]|uniref:tRNA-specific adenosine deaminase 1 n=1 Tax=Zophobas morio TaxID=2755281 RepID=UPI0030836E0B